MPSVLDAALNHRSDSGACVMTYTPLKITLALVALGVVLWFALGGPTWGDDGRAEWFKGLTVPQGAPHAGASCCGLGDGHPTQGSMLADGKWHVTVIPQPGVPKWEKLATKFRDAEIIVPPEIVLRTMSDEEWGYLFIVGQDMYCYVPPPQGF